MDFHSAFSLWGKWGTGQFVSSLWTDELLRSVSLVTSPGRHDCPLIVPPAFITDAVPIYLDNYHWCVCSTEVAGCVLCVFLFSGFIGLTQSRLQIHCFCPDWSCSTLVWHLWVKITFTCSNYWTFSAHFILKTHPSSYSLCRWCFKPSSVMNFCSGLAPLSKNNFYLFKLWDTLLLF